MLSFHCCNLKIKNIIKISKLTLTKNRKKVFNAFIKSGKPLSLKGIRLLVGDIDRVTLFRILSAFESKRIIHVINLESGQKLFALCNKECQKDAHVHNHIHFHCEHCDDVSCLPIKEWPQVSVPYYTFNNLSINASGLCINCKV